MLPNSWIPGMIPVGTNVVFADNSKMESSLTAGKSCAQPHVQMHKLLPLVALLSALQSSDALGYLVA